MKIRYDNSVDLTCASLKIEEYTYSFLLSRIRFTRILACLASRIIKYITQSFSKHNYDPYKSLRDASISSLVTKTKIKKDTTSVQHIAESFLFGR